MTISSTTFYSSSLSGILNQQTSISNLNQQIASGNKLLTAADDPVAASQIMSLNDRISLSTQYTANQTSLSQTQSEEGTILDQLRTTLASVQQSLTAVNASTGQNAKDSAAATLSGLYQQILDVANSQDTNGNYIFSGLDSSVKPYDPTTFQYSGNNGVRQVQISQGQSVQANDSLSTVMQVDPSTSTSALLQSISQAVADLQNGAISTSTLQTSLSTAYTSATNALSSLEGVQASLAGRQLQVSNQQTATQQFLAIDQNALGSLSQVDKASAIVELQMRQTSLQAAESAFASTSKLSLFNYL
jgi:flagellar hook-associated protein 3 FlgL